MVSELLGAVYEIMYMAFYSMLMIPKIDTKAFIYKTLEDKTHTQRVRLNT